MSQLVSHCSAIIVIASAPFSSLLPVFCSSVAYLFTKMFFPLLRRLDHFGKNWLLNVLGICDLICNLCSTAVCMDVSSIEQGTSAT